MTQIKVGQLLTNESGFSSTQKSLSSAQQQSTRRTAGYSEYEKLNEETDLGKHLNIDQHGNK
jgi:hypothetical protein